jgi:hypothetical protein
MASKADGESFKPANNTFPDPEKTRRRFQQVKGLMENGTYRINMGMIAVTLARLLKEQKRTTGKYIFPTSAR